MKLLEFVRLFRSCWRTARIRVACQHNWANASPLAKKHAGVYAECVRCGVQRVGAEGPVQ